MREAPLIAEVLTGADEVAALRPEWQALFDRVDRPRWCTAPEITAAWIATLREGAQQPVVAVRDAAGELRGVMVLMRDLAWRGPSALPRFDYDPRDRGGVEQQRRRPLPVRQLAAPASLPATMLWTGPLCADEDLPAVIAALGPALATIPGWDVAVFPVPDSVAGLWQEALAPLGRVRRQDLSREALRIEELAPFAGIVARQSKKYRQNVRRAEKFGTEAGLRIETFEGLDAVRERFDVVNDVARKSWKQDGQPGRMVHIPYDARQRRFFERILASPSLGGTPAVVVASDAAGPVAVITLIAFGRTVVTLLTFREERLDRVSPGLQVLGRAIDWAFARGATRIEFNATADWVRPLADTFEPIVHVCLFRRTMRGRLLAALSGLAGRVRR